MITDSAGLFCNGTCVIKGDSTANGSWENSHVLGDHALIAYLFSSNCKKWYIFLYIVAGWLRILDA
jgi:hypothetical protein